MRSNVFLSKKQTKRIYELNFLHSQNASDSSKKDANSSPLSQSDAIGLILGGISCLLLTIGALIFLYFVPHGFIHLVYALSILPLASLIEGIAIFRTYHHLRSPLPSRIICAFTTVSGALSIVALLLNLFFEL